MKEYSRIRNFVEAHYGDLISLYLLHLGLWLIYRAHGDSDIAHVGESFILTAVATLRFKGSPQQPREPHL